VWRGYKDNEIANFIFRFIKEVRMLCIFMSCVVLFFSKGMIIGDMRVDWKSQRDVQGVSDSHYPYSENYSADLDSLAISIKRLIVQFCCVV
jgi:hypothetical protein